jgi:hypothetical protein
MAVISSKMTVQCTLGGITINSPITDTADGSDPRIITLPVGATGVQVDIAFALARLKQFAVVSDQPGTMFTNADDGTGGDTIPLAANKAWAWSASVGNASPFTSGEDVLTAFLDNESTTSLAASTTAIVRTGPDNRTISATTQPQGGPRKLSVTCSAAASGNVVITGKDIYGNAQTESIAAVSSGTGYGSLYFKSIDTDGIAIPNLGTGTVSIGVKAQTGQVSTVTILVLADSTP